MSALFWTLARISITVFSDKDWSMKARIDWRSSVDAMGVPWMAYEYSDSSPFIRLAISVSNAG
jgi:hypothetical protein